MSKDTIDAIGVENMVYVCEHKGFELYKKDNLYLAFKDKVFSNSSDCLLDIKDWIDGIV